MKTHMVTVGGWKATDRVRVRGADIFLYPSQADAHASWGAAITRVTEWKRVFLANYFTLHVCLN